MGGGGALCNTHPNKLPAMTLCMVQTIRCLITFSPPSITQEGGASTAPPGGHCEKRTDCSSPPLPFSTHCVWPGVEIHLITQHCWINHGGPLCALGPLLVRATLYSCHIRTSQDFFSFAKNGVKIWLCCLSIDQTACRCGDYLLILADGWGSTTPCPHRPDYPFQQKKKTRLNQTSCPW